MWGLIASMYLGNLAGLIIVLTCVPLFAAILRVPFSIIAPIIVVICAIGAYSVHSAMLDIWLMMMFGVVGYVFKKLDYPLAPLVLALVLGDRAEDSFRQAMLIAQGDLRDLLLQRARRQHHRAVAGDAVLAGDLARDRQDARDLGLKTRPREPGHPLPAAPAMRPSPPIDRAFPDRAWRAFLRVAIVLMIIAAGYRVPFELWRLMFEPLGGGAAADLMLRYAEVHAWFAGEPTYGAIERADYPPASYLLLFPFVHWPTPQITRVVWALLSVVALAWLAILGAQALAGARLEERVFAALLAPAMYATAAALQLGQIGFLLLPLLVVGIFHLVEQEPTLKRDLVAGALLTVSLVKPTIAPPFLWIAFFRGGWRVTALIVVSYAALTIAAAQFQQPSLSDLVRAWLGQQASIDFSRTHGSVYAWLAAVGYQRHLAAVSLAILAAFGVWIWRHRHADTWKLLAVCAIVARLWTHHHRHDDVLMLLPAIALLRDVDAARAQGRTDPIGMVVLVLVWAFSVLPSTLLADDAPGSALLRNGRTVVWVAALVLIGLRARNAAGDSSRSAASLPSRS